MIIILYDMARVRKTISFKEDVLKKIDEIRGNKQLSTQVNEDYEEKFDLKKSHNKNQKGGKKR